LTLPEYYCKSGQIEVTETSLTKVILTAYASIFKNLHDILVMELWVGIIKIF
ncbi:6446_t:CDS:1, partial [Funneliformis caledonium]